MYRIFLENHYRVFAKTTGETPVVWEPDGRSRILNRRAPANIIENIKIIKRWAAANAQVAIMECMALHPETQYALAWKIFQPTHTFITNIGSDHFEAMGNDLQEISATMMKAATDETILFIPAQSDVIPSNTGKIKKFNPLKSPVKQKYISPVILDNHWGMMLEFIRCFNLNYECGVKIFREEWQKNCEKIRIEKIEKRYLFWNLFTVNDPDSAKLLITRILADLIGHWDCTVIFNGRKDRPLRTKSFAPLLALFPAGTTIWVTGSGRLLAGRFFRKIISDGQVKIMSQAKILENLQPGFRKDTVLFGLGNVKGVEHLIREVEQR